MKKNIFFLNKLKIFMVFFIFLIGLFFPSLSFAMNMSFLRENTSSLSFSPVLKKIIPAVVSITVNKDANVYETNNVCRKSFFLKKNKFFLNNSFFLDQKKKFFLHKNGFQVLGSGVIIDAQKGYVITNFHVVNDANIVRVELNDGRFFFGTVLGADPLSDVALIQLEQFSDLTAISIADSDLVEVGDFVLAIGNPYGLSGTVTSGIVSAIDRSNLNIANYENFIQTDVAINSGNSGGALVNLKGELIGMNTAILSPNNGSVGIGFAIPGNMIKSLTMQLSQQGIIKRGKLGIIASELNFYLAKVMGISVSKGAFINEVLPNSPACKAGIKAGDVIVSLNKKKILSYFALRAQISAFPANSIVDIGVLRDNKIKYFKVELQSIKKKKVRSKDYFFKCIGAVLKEFNSDQRIVVKVISVKINSFAFQYGFKVGDIILSMNNRSIFSLNDLKEILEKEYFPIVFHIDRNHNSIYLVK